MRWSEVLSSQRKLHTAGSGYHQKPVPGLSEAPGVVAGAEECHTLHSSFQNPSEAILDPGAYQEEGLQNLGPTKNKRNNWILKIGIFIGVEKTLKLEPLKK